MDSLINQASKYWFLTGERQSVPLVIRSVVGAGGRFGAIHSQMPISWLMGVPGLKIVAPSTPAIGEGAAEGGDPRPEPGALLRAQAPLLEEGADRRRPSAARARRARGRARGHRHHARQRDEGRRRLPRGGRARSPARGSPPRSSTCRRSGRSTSRRCCASLAKTNRIAVVEEGPRTGGWAGEVLALVDRAGRSATSTTPGGSRRPTRRSPTARRSRTPSCPGAERIVARRARTALSRRDTDRSTRRPAWLRRR